MRNRQIHKCYFFDDKTRLLRWLGNMGRWLVMSKRGKLMEQTFSLSNPRLFNEIPGVSVFRNGRIVPFNLEPIMSRRGMGMGKSLHDSDGSGFCTSWPLLSMRVVWANMLPCGTYLPLLKRGGNLVWWKWHGIGMAGDVIKISDSKAWNGLELNELHEET